MAALTGAGTVAILRLLLASIIIATVIAQAGASTTPLIIVAVVAGHLIVLALSASRTSTDPQPPG